MMSSHFRDARIQVMNIHEETLKQVLNIFIRAHVDIHLVQPSRWHTTAIGCLGSDDKVKFIQPFLWFFLKVFFIFSHWNFENALPTVKSSPTDLSRSSLLI